MKIIGIKALTCIFCLTLAKAEAQGVVDLLQQGMAVKHATVPIYPTGSVKASGVVRVDRIFTDYERRGFFRIGAFPIAVLDGFSFESLNATDPLVGLASLQRWMATKNGQHVELRKAKFIFSTGISLEAGAARCVSKDRWELTRGVHFISNGHDVHAERAFMETGGTKKGQVILDTNPRSTQTFLAPKLALQDLSHSNINDLQTSK